MDGYRPKKDHRPARRKDKDNPYEIFSVGINTDNPHFYVSFKDGQGVQICMEIDRALFELLDRFELDDLSFLNEWDRHIEHSELTEASLNARAVHRRETVEEAVFKQIENEMLHRAIATLPEVQRRRLLLYYFGNLTYQDIADLEGCSKVAVKYTIDKAIAALQKIIK